VNGPTQSKAVIHCLIWVILVATVCDGCWSRVFSSIRTFILVTKNLLVLSPSVDPTFAYQISRPSLVVFFPFLHDLCVRLLVCLMIQYFSQSHFSSECPVLPTQSMRVLCFTSISNCRWGWLLMQPKVTLLLIIQWRAGWFQMHKLTTLQRGHQEEYFRVQMYKQLYSIMSVDLCKRTWMSPHEREGMEMP